MDAPHITIFVFYGCEFSSVTLRKEQRLEEFENIVLRKIFGLRETKLHENGESYIHNSELHALYSSSDIIRNLKGRRLRWARYAYRTFVGKPKGNRPLGRLRHRCEDNIKMDLMKEDCDPGNWIALSEHRDQWRAYVRAVMNLRVP